MEVDNQMQNFSTISPSLIKDLLRAWKVLGRHYLKSGNSLDETHREEITQPVVKN